MPEQSTPLSGMTGVKVQMSEKEHRVVQSSILKAVPSKARRSRSSTGPILCLIGWRALLLRLSNTT